MLFSNFFFSPLFWCIKSGSRLQSSKYIMFSGSQVDTYEQIVGCDKANWCGFRHTHTVSAYYHCQVHPSVCPALRVYQHGSHWGDLCEIFWWRASMKICIQILNLVKFGQHIRHFTGRPKYVLLCLMS
jgi:hypothetical protein